jgi:hypothetical protein
MMDGAVKDKLIDPFFNRQSFPQKFDFENSYNSVY